MKLLLWVAKFLTKTNFTKWYRHVCIICQMICAASWHLIEVDVSSAFISNISQYKYDIWHFLGTTWSIHSKTCDWGVYSTIKTYLHPKYNFIWWIYGMSWALSKDRYMILYFIWYDTYISSQRLFYSYYSWYIAKFIWPQDCVAINILFLCIK